MTALQLAFESRLVVRAVRSDTNFENVMSLLKTSTRDELSARCPATDASLLFYAVQRKNDNEAEQICRHLCDEVNACDPIKADRNSQTSLFFAARDGNARCVKYLVSKGCNPDHRDTASQTALFYAARDGRTECVRALLESGADVNAADHLGQTALFYASRDGRVDTVAAMLEKGASMVVKDRQRRTALFYAQKNNHRELVTLLKTAGAANGAATPMRQSSGTDGETVMVAEIPSTNEGSQLEEGRPLKRPRLSSSDASPQLSPASLATSQSPLGAQSTSLPGQPHEQLFLPPIKRRCYRLVMSGPPNSNDPNLEYLSAPNEQIAIFEALAPTIAVWPISTPSPVTDIFHDFRSKWQAIALSIVEELAAVEGGWIFAKPVDCKAWGCPDYYEVVKQPMDYSTIKKKMKNHQYRRCSEFIADINLIFSNCFRYNKVDSPVASIGHNIERQFKDLVNSKGLKTWIDYEDTVERWYLTSKKLPEEHPEEILGSHQNSHEGVGEEIKNDNRSSSGNNHPTQNQAHTVMFPTKNAAEISTDAH